MATQQQEVNILVMEEVEFKSEKPPRYFRKGCCNLRPYLQDFDRRKELKLVFEDNSPYQKKAKQRFHRRTSLKEEAPKSPYVSDSDSMKTPDPKQMQFFLSEIKY